MILDALTGMVAAAVLCSCFSAAMLLVWRFLLPRRALLLWGIAMGSFALGTLLIVLRPFLPVIVTITAANQIIIVGYCFLWWGAAEYRGVRPRLAPMLTLVVLYLPLFAWYTYVHPLISIRIVIMQLYGVIFLADVIRMLFSTPRRLTGMERVTVAALLMDMTILLATAVVQIVHADYNEPILRNVVVSCYSLMSLITVSSFGLSFFLLILEQVFNEGRHAEADSRSAKELLETVPTVAIQGYGLDGRVIFWNRASESLYGYRADEALGANLLDLIIPPGMHDEFRQAILHMKETGIPVPAGELTLLRKDGTLVPVQSSHVLIQTEGGAPMMFCLDIDLSEHKRLEERLKHASDEWRRTFDTIPDLITILDNEHRIVRANRAAWQKLGCQVQDLLGKPCYTLFHGLDAPPVACPHAQLLLDGLAHTVEVIEPRFNCCVEVTVTPLHDNDGKVTGSIHIAHDITKMKRAGEALQKSEMLYRSILTASPDTIAITDLEGLIRMVSPAGLTMFGFGSIDELQGRSIVDFIVPEDRKRAKADIMVMFQGTLTGLDEYRALRADGGTIMVEANGDFIVNSDGQPESMIFVIRDITERKRVADELSRKNREIEQFIYTVSHDLRSPLVTVKTFLGFLEQDISCADSDRIGKDMEFIHTAADRMESLLNELLDMSRVGRATTPPEEVTFQELVGTALDAVAGQIATGRVEVRVSPADPVLFGDRHRLLQIWQNLMDNALKYMGDQVSPFIEIGVEQQEGETVFFVQDNGIGIAPAYHEKVFGIFEKLDRQTGGIGMGLTMVRRIVENHGGRIWVESEPAGTGSRFCFTLPGRAS